MQYDSERNYPPYPPMEFDLDFFIWVTKQQGDKNDYNSYVFIYDTRRMIRNLLNGITPLSFCKNHVEQNTYYPPRRQYHRFKLKYDSLHKSNLLLKYNEGIFYETEIKYKPLT